MSFDIAKLKSIGNNQGRGKTPVLWVYDNAEGDTVTTAGYVPSNVGVSARDQICVVPSGGDGKWYKATTSAGTITLAAVSA